MRRKDSGFTLIEVMIVLAIVGILASIAVSSFNGLRYKAYNATAIENARILFLFENSFYDENRQFVPVAASDVSASGVIDKNVTIDGASVNFSVKGLSPDITVAALTDANGQTVTVGAKHPSSTTIVAMDYDAMSSGFRKKTASGTFTEASLPAATSANDLAGWAAYP